MQVQASEETSDSDLGFIGGRLARLLFDLRKRLAFRADRKSLACSRPFRSYADIDTRNYDAVVVGSDVVWNFELTRLGRDPVYAAVFAEPFNGLRISYAPSIGRMDPAYVPPDTIIRCAMKLHGNGFAMSASWTRNWWSTRPGCHRHGNSECPVGALVVRTYSFMPHA